jgi:hypothetical protein
MTQQNPEEFGLAVQTVVRSVLNLYRQIDGLNAAIREVLLGEPDPLRVVVGDAPGKDRGMRAIRDAYGMLLGPAENGEDDEEDEDDAGADAEQDEPAPPRRRKYVELDPGAPLIALHVLVYDPAEPKDFTPRVTFAVIGQWGIDGGGGAPAGPVTVRAKSVPRLARALRPGTRPGGALATQAQIKGARGSRLTARCLTVAQSVPLVDLDGPDSIDRLATSIKTAWRSVKGS